MHFLKIILLKARKDFPTLFKLVTEISPLTSKLSFCKVLYCIQGGLNQAFQLSDGRGSLFYCQIFTNYFKLSSSCAIFGNVYILIKPISSIFFSNTFSIILYLDTKFINSKSFSPCPKTYERALLLFKKMDDK